MRPRVVIRRREVEDVNRCLDVGGLGFYQLYDVEEFRFGAREEEDVIALTGELEGEFFSNAIGRAGDNRP